MGTTAFIGGGNMATAIIGGLCRGGRPPDSLLVIDPELIQRERLNAAFGVRTAAVPDASLRDAGLVVWAVKPQAFREAAAPAAPFVGEALHLSVMAGIRSDAIVQATGSERVVRAMPNTPALIGQGISGLYARHAVTASGRAEVEAEGTEDRCDGDAGKAIDTAGDERCLVGGLPQHQPDAERHHEPRQIAAAHDEEAQEIANDGGDDRRGDQARDRLVPAMHGKQARRVGANAEERRVSE